MSDSLSLNERFQDETDSETLIQKMTRIWMNEKSCPDILFYEFSLMRTLEEYLERQVFE